MSQILAEGKLSISGMSSVGIGNALEIEGRIRALSFCSNPGVILIIMRRMISLV